jgi:hypothetical protein
VDTKTGDAEMKIALESSNEQNVFGKHYGRSLVDFTKGEYDDFKWDQELELIAEVE